MPLDSSGFNDAYFDRRSVTGPLKVRTDIFAPPSAVSVVSSEPRPNLPGDGIVRETLLVMVPAIEATENDALVLSGMAMSIAPLWVSKSNVPLRSRRPLKLTFPVTVSTLVRSSTPPAIFTAPLTVEKPASELPPRNVIAPDALFALSHADDPLM